LKQEPHDRVIGRHHLQCLNESSSASPSKLFVAVSR
jgi:hypothetical protein